MIRDSKNFFADKDIQVIIGTLLRVGVISSMTVVFLGGMIYLMGNMSSAVNYADFDPDKTGLSSIDVVLRRVGRMEGTAIIQFGVLLLIFTPILRVVFSVFSFLIERDYLYVLIGSFVLCVILFSLSNKLAG